MELCSNIKIFTKLPGDLPNYDTVIQIDHVITNQKWRSSLHDVKVRRGPDVGSDHMLVMDTLSLKLQRARRGNIAEVRCRKVEDP